MLDALTLVTGVAALLLAAWCGWAAYRDQPTKDWHFIGMAVVSVLALIQLVIGVVQLARGEKPEQGTTIFVAYLLGGLRVRPGGGLHVAGRADPVGLGDGGGRRDRAGRARSAALRHLGRLR
ncbi:hypothetical protein GCM10020256_64140 [Streptomyces thermocoprophilus]